jgi:8-oxo-dGTP pyrophosphatase MutT (NUDIX family)
MKMKKGAGAIVYRDTERGPEFLLLHRALNWEGYEFAKGGIKSGESPEETAKRELAEEAGLKEAEVIGKIEGKISWKKEGRLYDYDFFLVKSSGKEAVKLPSGKPEHDSYRWVKGKDVPEWLENEQSKEAFRKALDLLKGDNK